MGKEAETESVIPNDARDSEQAAAPTEVQETEQRQCCRAGVCGLTEGKIGVSHIFMLRVIGWLTMIFAATEFGVGGTLFNYFDNVKLGAWWVGILAFFAGACCAVSANKDWVLAAIVIAFAALSVAIVGAALDGESSHHFRAITTCASRHDGSSPIIYYGLERDNMLAQGCLYSMDTVEVDSCYCVSKNRRSCDLYTFSAYAMYYEQTCSDVITKYSYAMATSTALCVGVFVMCLILAATGALVLFRPELLNCCGPSTRQLSSKDHIPAQTSVIEEAPANAAAVPNAEVEAKVGVAIIA